MLHLAGELSHGLKTVPEIEGIAVQCISCRIQVADHQCTEDGKLRFFCQAEIIGRPREIAEGVIHEQVLVMDFVEIL